jgi:3-hydroxyisobutyrate dehydrogenase-like beta-hydroxyacid dehydrogenase
MGEALALGHALGLSQDATFDVLQASPLGAQAERRRPAIESGDYPPRFALTLARKDADLIAAAAHASAIELRLADATRAWLRDAEVAGWGDRDYAAMLGWILATAPGGRDPEESAS